MTLPSAAQEGRLEAVPAEDEYFMRLPDVQKLVPADRTTLWRWVKAGTFPAPVKLGPNLSAWPASQVKDWIKDRIEGGPK